MTDFDNITKVFTGWADIVEKARKPKGLKNWQRLQHVAHKLEGKGSAHIRFTAVDPVTGETSCHLLGSTEGNLKFLLGYGNPGFHFAPYHLQVIDPNLTDADADLLFREKGHPSNPSFWNAQGLPIPDEGDLDEGRPHPSVSADREEEEKKAKLQSETITVDGYRVDPLRGRVENLKTGHTYTWEVVKDTFFAYQNPKIQEAMAESEVSKALPAVVYQPEYAASIEEYRSQYIGKSFHEDVYPLVKTTFPEPGSVVRLEKNVYGVVTPTRVVLYDGEGAPVTTTVYGAHFDNFDLCKGGHCFPSVILNLATEYMGVDRDHILQYEHKAAPELPYTVEGKPTPGVSYSGSSERDVVETNGILRVRPTE